MTSRFPKKLTLEEQRKLASPTEEDTQKKRDKKYGEIGDTFKNIGKCVGDSCGMYRDLRAEYVDPHLVPVYENAKEVINKNMAKCGKQTGDGLEKCVASVKETAQNAAEAAGDVARNTAVAAHAAMEERFLPQWVHANRRNTKDKQEYTDAQMERDKQYPEFQLFVTTADGKTQALLVHGYHNIYDIKIMLQDRGVYIFNLFKVNGNTYKVDNNSAKTLSQLNLNKDNQTIIISGGTKKTKKRRKSTTTKRRKMVRRRKGTKRRV